MQSQAPWRKIINNKSEADCDSQQCHLSSSGFIFYPRLIQIHSHPVNALIAPLMLHYKIMQRKSSLSCSEHIELCVKDRKNGRRSRHGPCFPSLGVNMVLMKPPSYNQFSHGEELTRSEAKVPVNCREELKTKNYSIYPNRSPCLEGSALLQLPDKKVTASKRWCLPRFSLKIGEEI